MKAYERSHPWIKFEANLRNASPSLWVLLGEAVSKVEHLSQSPLKPALAKEFMQVALIKGAVATTAIEGNTLTEDQVRKILDGKLKLPPSQAYLKQEVDNVIRACNQLGKEIQSGTIPPMTTERIVQWNSQLLDGLKLEPEVRPGEIRKHSVTVGRYLGAPAQECEYLLGRLCAWLPTLAASAGDKEDLKMPFAIIQAILAHLYMAWIHPFGDGNGRTARMVEFQLLVQAGVPSVAAHLLSNHYNQTRSEYYRQLDHSSKSGGEILQFLLYATAGLVDGLRMQIDQVNQQQITLAWRDYTHEQIFETQSSCNERRFRLLKALTRLESPVKIETIIDKNGRLAKDYVGKTSKTMTRDINALIEMGLVEKTHQGLVARIELIHAFLPPRQNSNHQD